MTPTTSSSAIQAGGDETPVAWITEDGSKFIWDSTLERKGRDLYPQYTIPLFTRPTPAAAAGVPTADEYLLGKLAEVMNFLRALGAMRMAADVEEARAVLSAGAPAVPLQDSDSSSSHFAAPGSTVPTALTVGTPPSEGVAQDAACWLVEKRAEGRTVGFLGHALGTSEWFPTADRATRFVRREDANGVAECFEFEDVIIAEHIWG